MQSPLLLAIMDTIDRCWLVRRSQVVSRFMQAKCLCPPVEFGYMFWRTFCGGCFERTHAQNWRSCRLIVIGHQISNLLGGSRKHRRNVDIGQLECAYVFERIQQLFILSGDSDMHRDGLLIIIDRYWLVNRLWDIRSSYQSNDFGHILVQRPSI